MVTPFGPSARWLLTGEGVTGKEFARMHILSAGRETVLSVPVEGGANALKRRDASPAISGHGKWRREHLGALETAYSRTPYYPHLIPEIEAVYALPDGTLLEEFNRRLLEVALRWCDCGVSPEEMPRHVLAYGRETATKINLNLSIFDALFRFGKDTGIALASFKC